MYSPYRKEDAMHTKNIKSVIIIASLCSAVSAPDLCGKKRELKNHRHPFASLHNRFEEMHQAFREEMRAMEEYFDGMFDEIVPEQEKSSSRPRMTLSSNDDALTIQLHEVSNEDMVISSHDDNRITIKTPEINVNMNVHNHMLQVQMSQESKQEVEQEEGQKSCYVSSNFSQMYQSLPHELDVEACTSEYNQNERCLTVRILFIAEKTAKQIPITIVEK